MSSRGKTNVLNTFQDLDHCSCSPHVFLPSNDLLASGLVMHMGDLAFCFSPLIHGHNVFFMSYYPFERLQGPCPPHHPMQHTMFTNVSPYGLASGEQFSLNLYRHESDSFQLQKKVLRATKAGYQSVFHDGLNAEVCNKKQLSCRKTNITYNMQKIQAKAPTLNAQHQRSQVRKMRLQKIYNREEKIFIEM